MEGEGEQEGGQRGGWKKEEGAHGRATAGVDAKPTAAAAGGVPAGPSAAAAASGRATQGGPTGAGSTGGAAAGGGVEGRQVVFEGGCSGKFKASVASFLEQRVEAVERARLRLGLPLDRLTVGRGGRAEAAERMVRQGAGRGKEGARRAKIEEVDGDSKPAEERQPAGMVKEEPVTSADDVIMVHVDIGKEGGAEYVEAIKGEGQEQDGKVVGVTKDEGGEGREGGKVKGDGDCERLESSVAEKIAKNVAGITARQLKVRDSGG